MSDGVVLVTGSRSIDDYDMIEFELSECPFEPDVVIHGDGSRVDELGGVWGIRNGASVETHPVPDWAWEKIGRKSGPMRNSFMVEQADACVGIWDSESAGTKDTMQKAEADGLPVYRIVVDVCDGGSVNGVERREFFDGDQTALGDF